MTNFNKKKQFNKDNEWGTWGEGVMINFIQKVFKKEDKFVSYWYSSSDISKSIRQMKKWDLRFGVYNNNDRINYIDKFEVEIKTDGYEKNTGNLIFEKSSGGKKSGVFATEAKYFIYFLPLLYTDNLYLIKSQNLIQLLEQFDTHIIGGGDWSSNTKMYKIPRVKFDQEFITAGGKIITYNEYIIPDKFEKQKFIESKTTYTGEMKSYEDPFDFR